MGVTNEIHINPFLVEYLHNMTPRRVSSLNFSDNNNPLHPFNLVEDEEEHEDEGDNPYED